MVGDGNFARDQLRISFHRKDRIAAENIIYVLGYGTITDKKKEQCSVLIFCGKNLENIINLINGKLVASFKVNQLIDSGCAKRFNIDVLPPSGKINLKSHWLCGFMDSDGHIGIYIYNKIDTTTFDIRFVINFVQKESFLLELIVALFKTHKIHRNPLKDGRLSYALTFTSQKTLKTWMSYFNSYHLQSRKYWQFLKFKQCVFLVWEKQRNLLELQVLQQKLRHAIIPESARKLEIPFSFDNPRFSLTKNEMDQIDI